MSNIIKQHYFYYLKKGIQLIIIAIISAELFKFFLFQFYIIPTDSMANTLVSGDGIIVSRLQYGALISGYRLPGFMYVKRNDIVVFHDPSNIKQFLVKRAIGLPGETISIIHTNIFINDKIIQQPINSTNDYYIKSLNPSTISEIKRKLQLRGFQSHNDSSITAPLMPNEVKEIQSSDGLIEFRIEEVKGHQEAIYPEGISLKWNNDNYGPIQVPKKNQTIRLNTFSFHLYKKIIQISEGNTCDLVEDRIYINGKTSQFYKFKKNYYFMLGDNRNRSYDSRYWGFVPEDLIVGQAISKISISNLSRFQIHMNRL